MGKNRNFYQNNEEVTNETTPLEDCIAGYGEDAFEETAPVETPVVEDKKPEPTPEPEVKKVEPVVTNTTNKKPEIKSVQKKGTATL